MKVELFALGAVAIAVAALVLGAALLFPPSTQEQVTPQELPTGTPAPSPPALPPATVAAADTPSPPGATPATGARGEARLVFEREDGSLWATALDGRDPWPLTAPLPEQVGSRAVLWSVSPDGRWVAMVLSIHLWEDEATGQLVLIDLATGERHGVLDALASPEPDWTESDAARAALMESKPAWSPDGTRLAFVSAHEGNADLYVYEVDSGEIRRAASGGPHAAWPRWSPDGRHIVYNTVRRFGTMPGITGAGVDGGELWSVSPDGGAPPRRLSPEGQAEFAAPWVGEIDTWVGETWVGENAVLTIVPDRDRRDLTLIDLDSGARTPLMEGWLETYAWSEAAGLVAVSPSYPPYEDSAPPAAVYLVDPQDPVPILLAQIAPDENSYPNSVRLIRWSPDGRYLLFGEPGSEEETCFLHDRRTGMTRAKPSTWCGRPVPEAPWSPDGSRLLSIVSIQGDIETPSRESVTLIDTTTGQAYSLFEGVRIRAAWSPDGVWVIWRAQDREDGSFVLWAARADGGSPFRVASGITSPPDAGWVAESASEPATPPTPPTAPPSLPPTPVPLVPTVTPAPFPIESCAEKPPIPVAYVYGGDIWLKTPSNYR